MVANSTNLFLLLLLLAVSTLFDVDAAAASSDDRKQIPRDGSGPGSGSRWRDGSGPSGVESGLPGSNTWSAYESGKGKLSEGSRDSRRIYNNHSIDCTQLVCYNRGMCVMEEELSRRSFKKVGPREGREEQSQDLRSSREMMETGKMIGTFRARCQCHVGTTGQNCEKAIKIRRPRFDGRGYMAFTYPRSPRSALGGLDVTIRFRPSRPTDLAGDHSRNPSRDSSGNVSGNVSGLLLFGSDQVTSSGHYVKSRGQEAGYTRKRGSGGEGKRKIGDGEGRGGRLGEGGGEREEGEWRRIGVDVDDGSILDFFSIMLVEGKVEFRFDCGGGVSWIRTENTVVVNRWNAVRVIQWKRTAVIRLNDGPRSRITSKGTFKRITVRDPIYLGGYPDYGVLRRATLPGGGYRLGPAEALRGYGGCVEALRVNGREVDLSVGHEYSGDALRGFNTEDCSSHDCDHVTCLHGGSATSSRRHNEVGDDDDHAGSDRKEEQDEERRSATESFEDIEEKEGRFRQPHCICLCPLGTTGSRCQSKVDVHIPQFGGLSYISYLSLSSSSWKTPAGGRDDGRAGQEDGRAGSRGATLAVGQERAGSTLTDIELVLKATSPRGLILFNGFTGEVGGDYISLALVDNGYLEFSFNLGTGPAVIRSRQPVMLHEWHVIRLRRSGRRGQLIVDNQSAVEGWSAGRYTHLDLLLDMFLGGHPDLEEVSRHIRDVATAFRGCIQRLEIEGRPVSLLEESLAGANIDSCNHPCVGRPCQEGAECIPVNELYHCSCTHHITPEHPMNAGTSGAGGSGGSRMAKDGNGIACDQDVDAELIKRPRFTGDSFLLYTDPQIIKRARGLLTDVQFVISSTFRPDGLLLWVGDEHLIPPSTSLSFNSSLPPISEPPHDIVDRHDRHDIRYDVTRHYAGHFNDVTNRSVTSRHAATLSRGGVTRDDDARPQGDIGFDYSHISSPLGNERGSGNGRGRDSEVNGRGPSVGGVGRVGFNMGEWGRDLGTEYGDYLSLGLKDGNVVFSFDVGNGEVRLVWERARVDDGRQHVIRARRLGGSGYLDVDGMFPVEITSHSGSLRQLNSNGKLYIGGARDVSGMTSSRYRTGFFGCIQNFTLETNYHVDLIRQASEKYRVEQCPSDDS